MPSGLLELFCSVIVSIQFYVLCKKSNASPYECLDGAILVLLRYCSPVCGRVEHSGVLTSSKKCPWDRINLPVMQSCVSEDLTWQLCMLTTKMVCSIPMDIFSRHPYYMYVTPMDFAVDSRFEVAHGLPVFTLATRYPEGATTLPLIWTR